MVTKPIILDETGKTIKTAISSGNTVLEEISTTLYGIKEALENQNSGGDGSYDEGYTFGYDAGYAEGYDFGYVDGTEEGYEEGYEEGETAAENTCAEKHFATAFVGDGTDTATINVPFAPDVMFVSGVHPFHATASGNNMVAMFVFDLRAFGLLGGMTLYGNASTSTKMQTTMLTTTSMLNRYNRADDGTVTITCTSPSVFVKGITYMVTAAKALDQSDKERIEEFVQGLVDSGSVTLNRAKINAAFTDEEWAALIAQAPGWTFSFI